jgi:hypothetical protein
VSLLVLVACMLMPNNRQHQSLLPLLNCCFLLFLSFYLVTDDLRKEGDDDETIECQDDHADRWRTCVTQR